MIGNPSFIPSAWVVVLSPFAWLGFSHSSDFSHLRGVFCCGLGVKCRAPRPTSPTTPHAPNDSTWYLNTWFLQLAALSGGGCGTLQSWRKWITEGEICSYFSLPLLPV